MQIAIEIPDECYTNLLNNCHLSSEEIPIISLAIATGVPLSKGHGRIIDENKISSFGWDKLNNHAVVTAPTIIEANKE